MRIKWFISMLTLALALAICPAGQPPVAKPTPKVAGLFPIVRLRKIHIVRPDLIPYPIEYEIDC